ncbi:unnamed protein product, partial [Cochlearia groenlandica]
MVREESLVSIPIDLIIEILSRLHVKSIARFRCVSKLWLSTLVTPCFTELFLTRSSARPRLLFAVGEWCVMTTPQPHYNPYNKSSSCLVLTTDFLKKLPQYIGSTMIYNPNTGHHTMLSIPNLSIRSESRSFLGFDPINKQYKVLSFNSLLIGGEDKSYRIFTLGDRRGTWRKLQCPLNHLPGGKGICIDGVLYYLAYNPCLLVCFDVKSEIFKFIEIDFDPIRCPTTLINYKGKLGVITKDYDSLQNCLKLSMWLKREVESELVQHSSFSWDDEVVDKSNLYIAGVTASSSEVVLSKNVVLNSKPFYIYLLDLQRNSVRSVEIQGFGDKCLDNDGRLVETRSVKVFVDHVEDIKFI